MSDPIELRVADVEHRYGDEPVLRGVSVVAEAGDSLVLLGPSGCGKTTLLRVVAGLERPSAGTVQLGDAVVTSPSSFVPPERRRVGMVFQDGALFPHLSVAENVAFGVPKGPERDRRVNEALELVGLDRLGHRRPDALSGGQRQRVALARAIAPQPSVLLLDEPFASLDAALRVELRAVVHRLLHELGITSILVTHDQDEAFVLGDRVAVMRDGEILQVGRPAELYRRPVDPWVATFVGEANLVRGALSGSIATTALGSVTLEESMAGSGEGAVLLRPEHVAVAAGGEAIVRYVEFYGHDTVYLVELPDGAEIRARVGAAPMHREGDGVRVSYVGPPVVAYSGSR